MSQRKNTRKSKFVQKQNRNGNKEEGDDDDLDTKDENDDEDADDDDESNSANASKKSASSSKKSGGLNFTALAILLMFILPAILTGYLQVVDYLYPEAAKTRVFRDRLVKCYNSANPSKLKEIDGLVDKYKGKEHILFAKLRDKYPRVSECQ